MKLIKWLLILIIIAVIAIALTPLNLYYKNIQPQLKPLQLQNISGSIVKGSAEQAHYAMLPLGKLDWLLYPTRYNAIGGDLKVNGQYHDLHLAIKRADQNHIRLSQIRGYLDLQPIKPLLQVRYGELQGVFNLDLYDIDFHHQQGIRSLSGKVTLQDFKMLKPINQNLGPVYLDFETKRTGVIAGTISNQSALINISGSLHLQEHRWQLKLDLVPKAGNFEIDAIINNIGDARYGGGRRLNLAGFY